MSTAWGALTATVLLTGLVAGCTSRLGAVPIPSAPTGVPGPVTASVGHPQLLAMGAPVAVSLPGGARAVITAAGPAEDPPPGPARPNDPVTRAITVTAASSAGPVRLSAVDLQSRDQTGTRVTLTPIGTATVSATPGHPATLRLSGAFHPGGAQINWQQDGHVLAIWDFTIETD